MLAHNLCGVSQFERSDGMGGCGFDFVQDERIPSNLFPISWVRWAILNTCATANAVSDAVLG